jgi:hypothetical protein
MARPTIQRTGRPSIEAVGSVHGRFVRAPQMTRSTAAGRRTSRGIGTTYAVPVFGEIPVPSR